jgi:hypothetical protein
MSSLGDAKSSLGDAKSSLGDAKSSLGDAKSSLGAAESSLGDAESSLGDAESSLGDAKSSLGDAKSSLVAEHRDGAADTSVAAAVPHGLGGSRWAAAGDDDDDATAAAARDRKRQRRDREVGAAGASGVEEGDIHVAIKNLASAMGGKKGRRVRWVDEEAEKEAAKVRAASLMRKYVGWTLG